MKKVLVIGLLLLCSALPVRAEIKIGHFDLQKLVSASDAGKQAQAAFSAKQRKFQDDIDGRSARLKALKESIDTMSAAVKPGEVLPAALVEKDKEYGAQNRELQRLAGGYQEELKVYDAEMTRKVIEEFAPILSEYADKNGYDYILRASEATLFASPKLDLTEKLIKEFNEKRKNK